MSTATQLRQCQQPATGHHRSDGPASVDLHFHQSKPNQGLVAGVGSWDGPEPMGFDPVALGVCPANGPPQPHRPGTAGRAGETAMADYPGGGNTSYQSSTAEFQALVLAEIPSFGSSERMAFPLQSTAVHLPASLGKEGQEVPVRTHGCDDSVLAVPVLMAVKVYCKMTA
jgi:hypothetical protein